MTGGDEDLLDDLLAIARLRRSCRHAEGSAVMVALAKALGVPIA
jgi:hypothetical protein